MEKAWLSEHEVEFTAKNIVEDAQAMQELEEWGVFSTPVTIINDEVVVGFDRETLTALLGL